MFRTKIFFANLATSKPTSNERVFFAGGIVTAYQRCLRSKKWAGQIIAIFPTVTKNFHHNFDNVTNFPQKRLQVLKISILFLSYFINRYLAPNVAFLDDNFLFN